MTDLVKDILLIWGALLSTSLALLQFLKHYNDKPKVSVDVSFVYRTTDEETDIKGTRAIDKRNHFVEILLHVTVKNYGQKPVQVSAIFVKINTNEKLNEIRIIPDGFPVVISALCSVETEIQKEWIDGEEVICFGVIDGLGNYYNVNWDKLTSIVEESNAMPSNKKRYVNKTDPNDIVFAFQAKDKSIIVSNEK